MYYIASLAKFGNRCSTVWARRQDQWESNNYSLSFRRMRKKLMRCFYAVATEPVPEHNLTSLESGHRITCIPRWTDLAVRQVLMKTRGFLSAFESVLSPFNSWRKKYNSMNSSILSSSGNVTVGLFRLLRSV